MKPKMLIFFSLILYVEAVENNNRAVEEARDKGNYAMFTNLFILFAAKVGLFKIWLGIALVLGTIKLGVFMAWALATFKYVPDPYIFYKTVDYKPKFHFDPFNGYHNNADRDEYIHDIHLAYVIATKLFVLKIVYGIILFVLIYKAWHFGLWFVHYLKQKKHDHYDYIDHEPYHDHYEHAYDHGHHDHYGPSHQPYSYDKYGYGGKRNYDAFGTTSYSNSQDSYSNYYSQYATDSSSKTPKGVYDSDGSYSVKS